MKPPPLMLTLLPGAFLIFAALAQTEPPAATPSAAGAAEKSEPDGFTLLHLTQQALNAFDLETSEKLARRALEITVKENGGEAHPAVAQALLLLGRTLHRQERPAEAVQTLVRALDILDRSAGPESPLAVAALPDLLEARHRMGQHAEAVVAADRLLKSLAAAFEPDDAVMVETGRLRGQSLLALGRLDEAQAALTASQQRAAKIFGEGSPVFAQLQGDIEQVSRKRGGPVVPRFVGALGNTKRLAFEGNVSFPAAALITGLLENPPFFRASHPSAPLADYLKLTQSALTEGYQASGFRDAKVTVEYDAAAEMIRARITEGQRFRRGAIRIEGVRQLDPEALRRTLVAGAKAPEDDELSQIEEAVKSSGQIKGDVTSAATLMVDQVAGISAQGGKGNLADHSLSPEDQRRKAAELLKDLTQKQMPFTAAVAAVWEAGQSPSFASGAQDSLRSSLSGHFLHQGFPQAKYETAFETDEASGQVTLVVRVTDEGPPARLGRVTILGLKRNTKAGILGFLGLKEGQALQPDTLRTANLALWHSGRFRKFSLTGVLREIGKPEVDLSLDVLELENAPPVDQPLPPELAAMVRCARFLSSVDRTGQDFVMDLDFMDVISGKKDEKAKQIPKLPKIDKAPMSLAFSPAGVMACRVDVPEHSERLLLTVDRRFLQMTSDLGGMPLAWRIPAPGGVSLGMSLLLNPDSAAKAGSFNFWLKGVSRVAETPFRSSLIVAPALMLYHGLASTSRIERSGGVVKVTLDSGELAIDEVSGHLIGWKMGESASNARFRQVSGEAARTGIEASKMWDETPAAQKVEVSFETVFGLGALVVFGQFDAGSARDETADPDWMWMGGRATPEAVAAVKSAMKLVGSIDGIVRRISAGMAPDKSSGKAEDAFSVPFDASSFRQGNSLMTMLGPGIVAMADGLLPEGSWGQRLAREVAYASGGQPATSAKAFEEIAADPALGPVSCLWAAQTLLKFSQEQAAVHFLRRASVLTQKEHFRRDWMPLTQGEWFGPEFLRTAVAQVMALTPNEIDALNRLLPPAVSTVLKSALAGLQEKRDLPTAQQIGPVLDLLWDMGLAGVIRKAARTDLPPPDPVVDPAEVAAVVNGVPVSRRVVDCLLRTGTFFDHVPAPERPADAPPLTVAGMTAESLIQMELAVQFFRKMKGTFKEEVIDQLYQQLADQAGGEKTLLAAHGLRAEEFKKLLQDRQISGYVVGELRKRIESPGDAEVDAMEDEWRRDQAREYHLHTINFPPGASLPDRLNWACGLRGLIDKLVPFDVFMHASNGTASSSRMSGFCFGWPARQAMEEPIRSAVMKLKPGETTPPVILPNGNVALFSLEEVREGSPAKVKATRDSIRASLLEQRQNKAMEEWFAKARSQSRIRLIDLPAEGINSNVKYSPVEDFVRKASFIPAAQIMKLFASLRDGRLEDAGKAMDGIESLQLPDALSYSLLAGALNSKDQPALAQRAARAGTELDPEHAGSWHELGRALLHMDKPHLEEAAAAFRSAVKLKPEFPEAHRNLGLALEQQGKLEEAVASWRTAVKLQPDFPEAWTDLVRGLKAAGKAEEAEAAAAQAPAPPEKPAECAPGDPPGPPEPLPVPANPDPPVNCSLPSPPSDRAPPDADPAADAKAWLDTFRSLPVPSEAQITAAAKVAEVFLGHAFAGRAAEALPLADARYSGAGKGETMTQAFRAFAQAHGPLKSALLLRGRSVADAAPPSPDKVMKAAVPRPALLLFYLCETDTKLHRTFLRMEPDGSAHEGWKVDLCYSAPLEKDGWTAWDMWANAGLGTALKAAGAAPSAWEPLLAAAGREAKLMPAPLPPAPPMTGKPVADSAAAATWMAETLPDLIDAALPGGNSDFAEPAVGLSILYLSYQSGTAPKDLLTKIAKDYDDQWNWAQAPILHPALSAGWSVVDFRRLTLALAARLAMTRDGADWDPLHHTMLVATGDPDTLQELEGEKSQFGGPIALALAKALENAAKALGWEVGFKLTGDDETEFFLLEGSMTMAGNAASVSIDSLPDESSLRLILLGPEAWSSGDKGKTWRKSAGGRYERIFMALARAIREKWFAPQGAAGKWFFFGMSSRLGSPDDGGKSQDGDYGAMRWEGKVPIYETYEIERPRGPGPGEHPGKRQTFSITKSASGTWRLDGIKQELDLGLGGGSVESIQMGMRPLYRKPEITAPADHR